MGNMVVNKRVEETMFSETPEVEKNKTKEYRIFPSHMYGGPKGFGDPNFRGMSKMEEDPLITQRMRDIARTQMCDSFASTYNQCGKEMGVKVVYKCRQELSELTGCLEKWFFDTNFKERVTLEYLNERSHFRETGVQTPRYHHGKFIPRDKDKDGPALDENNLYRPQKPNDWDKYYSEGPPSWTDYRYD